MYYLFGKIDCDKTKEIKNTFRQNKEGFFFIPVGMGIPYLGLVKDVLEKYSEEDYPILVKGKDDDYNIIKEYLLKEAKEVEDV